jgi:hypothetical protein
MYKCCCYIAWVNTKRDWLIYGHKCNVSEQVKIIGRPDQLRK